ncbi:MAG: helix-turn-helix domain-containing protein [Gammaproteobacteria bacterium]|jgi:HTH-type transcriptional regulator/antitoxin HigA|nr:helix-turn-helix domain-containing protein [Gammaproteobacteria bacterium]MBT3489603.1 helix-turn-helix domain-containing protein [Gammaproteobacteria bacterium]MBT3719087.1 helix-turn-helix domain-containing protein [Gammaproteobacteria bacterium]MBT3843960.1 helix-turn-helix domain-containing protein [Gammaproteobacteria bacterium]MBT3892126.1 helix-turn-helix domain-containing protein [Gammaproteobacteria bacterium]
MTELTNTFQPDWVSPPGDTIFDLLEEKGWSQVELAQRTEFSTKHISQLINGKATIAEETAIILERVLGSSARFWLNREVQYREAIAREEEFKSLEQESGWLRELPLELFNFGL